MNEKVNAKPYLFQQLKALYVEKTHSLFRKTKFDLIEALSVTNPTQNASGHVVIGGSVESTQV